MTKTILHARTMAVSTQNRTTTTTTKSNPMELNFWQWETDSKRYIVQEKIFFNSMDEKKAWNVKE